MGDIMKHRDEIIAYTTAPHLEIVGNTECVIDGIKGILEYTKDKIKIDFGKYAVTFVGDELCIDSFSHEGAVVEGTIISVEFCGNG